MKRDDTAFKYLAIVALLLILLLASTPIMVALSRGFAIEEEFKRDFMNSLLLSVFSSLTSSSISTLLAIPLSYYTSRFLRGLSRRIVYSLLMMPVVMTPSAIGSLLLEFFTVNPIGIFMDRFIGVVNNVVGVVVAQVFVSLPVAIAYYSGLFTGTPRVYEELALEAGFSRGSYLYRVLLPMLKRQVIAGYALTYARAFSDFGATLILGGGVRGRTWTLPILVYSATYMGGLSTVSVVLIIYILLAFTTYYALTGLETTRRSEVGV